MLNVEVEPVLEYEILCTEAVEIALRTVMVYTLFTFKLLSVVTAPVESNISKVTEILAPKALL